ncbi:helix-turn-helix transcriptional regulator [Vibrio coralliilyticus]|uniref:helix-turn-helix transcriptional regulator n=1 Tax=Vibrio coralliilyticus TaxID=190893 RepID=UPI000BAC152F|nr:helix-turn-helix transcriptional regulator [Vibrio coralliilyticus]NOI74444.1 helix-turn-helix transcriptional regulator [Vibrio coralliilyticus]PAW05040.1 AraC family transcriptional regulator [Vibrio coralliilyticus]
MKSNVWIRAGVVIIYGSSIDASPHRHHAIQLAWPRRGYSCELDHNEISTPVIIDSNIEHQLQIDEGWILLVEPTSELGVALSNKLKGQPSKVFETSEPTFHDTEHTDDLTVLLSPLFEGLDLSNQFPLINESQITDHRIKRLLHELNQCLDGSCLKPTSWRASDVAQKLALSESRFLHLFSKELGIPWRPYLLWCRMLCAVRAILNGEPATDAAHMAGFSDSAHLSRTFRKTFGMTIRQANAIFLKS